MEVLRGQALYDAYLARTGAIVARMRQLPYFDVAWHRVDLNRVESALDELLASLRDDPRERADGGASRK